MASHPNGQVGHDPVCAVLRKQGDAAALRKIQRLQVCGHASNLVAYLCPGEVGDAFTVRLDQVDGIGLLTLPTVQSIQWRPLGRELRVVRCLEAGQR
ncbi:hypothetical protein D3C76_1536190 [compost metagenome]